MHPFIHRASCLLAIFVPATAQPLWDNTSYGMSLPEVQAAVPGASVPANPGTLAGGLTERLRLEAQALVERQFTVGLYFSGEKLAQVMLFLKVQKEDTFESCLAAFDALGELLRAKYGDEVSKIRNDDGPGYRRFLSEWSSGSARVGVLLWDAKGRYSLNHYYQVRPANAPGTSSTSIHPSPTSGFEIVGFYGAADDGGTFVRTVTPAPIKEGDLVLVSGTGFYDGKWTVLEMFPYKDPSEPRRLWGYRIEAKWRGLPPGFTRGGAPFPNTARLQLLPAAVQPNPTSDDTRVFDLALLDQRPEPTYQLRPQYPAAMQGKKLGGEVLVDFIVDQNGDVRNPFALRSTRREFESAAVAAVSQWKFKPGRKGGRPVPAHMQVPIVFAPKEK